MKIVALYSVANAFSASCSKFQLQHSRCFLIIASSPRRLRRMRSISLFLSLSLYAYHTFDLISLLIVFYRCRNAHAMSEKFRAQMKAAEAERQAAEAKRNAEATERAKQFKSGSTASATLDSYDSTIRHGGRDGRLQYSDTQSFEWGPWLLRKILLAFNGFFILLGVIVVCTYFHFDSGHTQ